MKVAHGRVGFTLPVENEGVGRGFIELVVHEPDCKGRAIVSQMSNVRKGHPWHKGTAHIGHEVGLLSGPTRSSWNRPATPRVAQTLAPS